MGRKVLCEHYSECLTIAVRENRPDFSCDNCDRFAPDRGITPQEFLGACTLIAKAYRPKIHRQYRYEIKNENPDRGPKNPI